MEDQSKAKDTTKVEREMYGHVYADDYAIACNKSLTKAEEIGAKTSVNYVPTQNGVLMRATSDIKESAVLNDDPKEIFQQAEGFEFVVVAVGPDVKNIELGEVIDVKSMQGVSLRPFVPHPQNVTVWRKNLKADPEAMIRHNLHIAEDAGRVGSGGAVSNLQVVGNPMVDAAGMPLKKGVDIEKTITIVEHFATEDHNVSAVYEAIEYVREVGE